MWKSIPALKGTYTPYSIPYISYHNTIYNSQLDIANTLAQNFSIVSVDDTYNPTFRKLKFETEKKFSTFNLTT